MRNDAIIFNNVLTYIRDFSTAIDVGAHQGDWTEKMASSFNLVHCFEPNTFLYARLCARFPSPSTNVVVYNTALLDFNGCGTLYHVDGSVKLRSSYVMEDADGNVEVRTLDSYRIRGCGLLKIDVEGGELLVLRHARQILRHQKPVVVVECKTRTSARFGWSLADLLRYMKSLKYRLAFGVDPDLVFVGIDR